MATTIQATFLAALVADNGGGGVATLATGGVLAVQTSGAAPITTTTAPAAFATDATSGVVQFTNPVVVLATTGGPAAIGPANYGIAEWVRVAVFALTYAETQAILARVYTLLHEEIITLTDGRQVDVTRVDTPWTNQIDDRIQPRGAEFVVWEGARYLCRTSGGKAI